MAHRAPIANLTSTADPLTDGRLSAPSAQRNLPYMLSLLEEFAPRQGSALELASGTGEQIVAFAGAFPDVHWQPTDTDPTRLHSIAAWIAHSGAPNVAPPHTLDATHPGWGQGTHPRQLLILSNLLHLISDDEAKTLIHEGAKALASGGRFILYGPFMRAGELTSEGDIEFHAALQAHDPQIGYKDDFDTLDWCIAAGMDPLAAIEMPANNLALIVQKF